MLRSSREQSQISYRLKPRYAFFSHPLRTLCRRHCLTFCSNWSHKLRTNIILPLPLFLILFMIHFLSIPAGPLRLYLIGITQKLLSLGLSLQIWLSDDHTLPCLPGLIPTRYLPDISFCFSFLILTPKTVFILQLKIHSKSLVFWWELSWVRVSSSCFYFSTCIFSPMI